MENTQQIQAQSSLIFWNIRLLLSQAEQETVRSEHITLLSALGALEGTLPMGVCSGIVKAVSEQLEMALDTANNAFSDLVKWGYFEEIDVAANALRDLEGDESEEAKAIKVLLNSEDAQVGSSHKHYELVANHNMVAKLHMSGE